MKFIEKHSGIIAALLLAAMFSMGLFSMLGDSGTTDEIAHIPAGYSYIKYFDYRLNPEHPPLLKAIASLPLLFMDLNFPEDLPAWKDDVNGQWETGWKFIYHYENDADQMLFWNRYPILLYALLLGIYVYLWTRDLFGKKTALFALFLFSFSPNILAHSRLVTTDLGVAASFFITLYYFYKFIKDPSWRHLFYSGIFFGIAQLVKFSNIFLVVYLGLLVLLVIFCKHRQIFPFNFPGSNRIKSLWLQRSYTLLISLVLIFVIGFLLVEVVYVVFTFNMPTEVQSRLIDTSLPGGGALIPTVRDTLHAMQDNFITKPFAQYILGLFMVFARVQGGNTTYFWGETTDQSWWYYYPLSFLIKTPISTIVLAMAAMFLFVLDFFKQARTQKIAVAGNRLRNFYRRITASGWKFLPEIIIVSVIFAFFVIGMSSNLNIGLRHVLPIYPFMFMLIAKYVVQFFGNHKTKVKNLKRSKIVLLVIIILYYLMTNFVSFPHYLAYFNEFIGRDNAYKYTVDSNLDWGQDLKRLASYVEENNIEHIKIDYFGGSVPEYYMGDRQEEWRSNYGETTGWLAVSATYFQNSKYYADNFGEKDYRWLEKYQPETIIGGSILVYKIEE
ncbi:glycosyltransferase family 39 protein [Patescibacteria group bacterium]|nr:glycosyltransferase family 39 protein [Patescibacteria group bacterium]